MGYPNFERGTATMLSLVRSLCSFARRYDYARLMMTRTGTSDMGDAIEALIAACDAFQAIDNNPWEADAIAPSTSPEDTEV